MVKADRLLYQLSMMFQPVQRGCAVSLIPMKITVRLYRQSESKRHPTLNDSGNPKRCQVAWLLVGNFPPL